MRILIIGNGIAGFTAAKTLREKDAQVEILLVGEEKYPTYQRLKLSHALAKPTLDPEALYVKPEDWYKEQKITLKKETRVETIDFDQKKVVTETGESIDYDRLILANGAHSFVPPIEGAGQEGVKTLRSLEDLLEIQEDLEATEEVAVIGGGLLGLEAAFALKEQGKRVHVVEFFPYLLPRQLDEELAAKVQTALEEEGLVFHLGTGTDRIEREESGQLTLHLSKGSAFSAGLVLVSAGIRPNTALFENTALKMDKGVVVDDQMATNLPDVWACGDVAAYQGRVFGLWTASTEQGKIAGENALGGQARYEVPRLVTTLSIGQVKLFSTGDVAEPDETITYREGDRFHRLFIKDQRIVGGVLTGDLSQMLSLRKLVDDKQVVKKEGDEGEQFLQLLTKK